MDTQLGLNMCEALEKVNRKLGVTNFKLFVRIGKRYDESKAVRWDERFVEDHLMSYAGNIRKIWVSGPPFMNQSLERTFETLGEQLQVKPHMIDVL